MLITINNLLPGSIDTTSFSNITSAKKISTASHGKWQWRRLSGECNRSLRSGRTSMQFIPNYYFLSR
ncbi:MAG: hypothetical protein ACK4HE_05095 [Chitinophagaceae bacterium]